MGSANNPKSVLCFKKPWVPVGNVENLNISPNEMQQRIMPLGQKKMPGRFRERRQEGRPRRRASRPNRLPSFKVGLLIDLRAQPECKQQLRPSLLSCGERRWNLL